jgi:hypothetical protein
MVRSGAESGRVLIHVHFGLGSNPEANLSGADVQSCLKSRPAGFIARASSTVCYLTYQRCYVVCKT